MKKYLLVILFLIIGLGCKKAFKEPSTIYFYSVVASPTNSESVTLKNNSGVLQDLSGWIIGDANNPNAYTIPAGTISQGEILTFAAATMGFQINDSGETLYLKDSGGQLISTWTN